MSIATGSYIKDGKEYVAASLDMSVNNASSIYVGDIEINLIASYLPFMWGFGDVPAGGKGNDTYVFNRGDGQAVLIY